MIANFNSIEMCMNTQTLTKKNILGSEFIFYYLAGSSAIFSQCILTRKCTFYMEDKHNTEYFLNNT